MTRRVSKLPQRLWVSGSGWAAAALLLAWTLAGSAHAQPARVMAASSLEDVVTELAQQFAATGEHPRPTLSFSSSSQLVRQLGHGAPADVVMTADRQWMSLLEQRGDIDGDTVATIASNRLVVVTPAEAPAKLGAPSGLLDEAVASVAVAADYVPQGARAREALRHAGILNEVTAKLVVAKNASATLSLVERNEVDAGIVYASDAVRASTSTLAFAFPEGSHQDIVYPVALTATGSTSGEAQAFARFLQSPQAAAVLDEAGFGPPLPPAARGAQPSSAALSRAGVPTPQGGLSPFWLSLWVATISLLLAAGPAIALGWLLARRDFPGKTLVSTALMTPLVLPPVVVGFTLLELCGRNGPLAPLLDALGVEIAFTRWGAVVAATVVAFPLLVLMSRLAIEAVDPRYEEVAQTLGRTRRNAFIVVGLPLAFPGLAAGCVLAFARALGEFGATIVLASDVPGQTRTLALAIFSLYEQPGLESEAHRLIWISIAVCAVALVAYERLNRAQKRRLREA